MASGVAGLDTVLGGGLLSRRLYLVKGSAGSGKTVLASQLCFHRARERESSVFVTMLSESHSTLLENLRTFDFFDEELIIDHLTFVSGYSVLEEGGLEGLSGELRSIIRKRSARFLVLDSIGAPSDHARSPDQLKRFIRDVAAASSLLGCTVVCVAPPDGAPVAAEAASDGIIELARSSFELRTVRTLEVLKLRGTAHLEGKHLYDITSAGFTVHPRTEARLAATLPEATAQRGRLKFGVTGLDQMTLGGIAAASSTAVLGAPGSGKTLLGLQFLAEGARSREQGLYFGFYETPGRLISKAEGIGLPYERYTKAGRIQLHWQPALEYPVDALAEKLLEAVHRLKVRRLFIDGVNGFEAAAFFPARLPRFLTALTNELRALGVTTLLSEEAELTGGMAKGARLSNLFENILYLRYVELRSHLYRFFSIVKMRESDYDSSIREFRIRSSGIELAGSFQSAEAILSGSAGPAPSEGIAVQPRRRSQKRGSRSV